jgi:3-oxoacyl-[acyl-carrier-protein] synthase-3
MKLAVASLTIGSGSAAVLLTHRDQSRSGNRLLAATARAHSVGHELCRGQENVSDAATAAGGMVAPLMQTDSERLLEQGVAAAQLAFDAFQKETGWARDDISKTICHQVGSAHQKLLLKTLGLSAERDFTTYQTLGNSGSVALPITLAKALEAGHVQRGDRAALLGIGSGINVLMLALEFASAP